MTIEQKLDLAIQVLSKIAMSDREHIDRQWTPVYVYAEYALNFLGYPLHRLTEHDKSTMDAFNEYRYRPDNSKFSDE